MNQYYFIVLFLILVGIAATVTINIPKKKEGFQERKDTVFMLPESPVKPTQVSDNLQAYTYPSDTLLSPSPGQIASFNSLPYIDPSLEKAKYQRILNVQTTLQGFLENEAKAIQEISDPSVVLPLTTARGDLTRLRNEVMVLQRNPGINSSLTQKDVDEIEANLAYLQKKWRLSIYNDINNIENFQVEGFQNSDRASLNELRSLITKIDTTTTLLSSSGTNDPVFTARIQALNALKTQIQNIINDVESGARQESEIPITHSAYENFLNTINDTSSPITNLLNNSGLPTTLSDLFPAYSNGDASGANVAKYLFQQYADTLFKGLSWNLNINYTSEAEQNLANNLVNSISTASASSTSTQNQNPNVTVTPLQAPTAFKDVSDNRGQFTSVISNLTNQMFGSGSQGTTPQGTIPQGTTPQGTSASQVTKQTAATKFDWHERANFICDAIQKRGLNPDDFGCLKPDQYVSDNFSWRGYAKMICGRLGTSYDTGLPESCGCPPPSWAGWRA